MAVSARLCNFFFINHRVIRTVSCLVIYILLLSYAHSLFYSWFFGTGIGTICAVLSTEHILYYNNNYDCDKWVQFLKTHNQYIQLKPGRVKFNRSTRQ